MSDPQAGVPSAAVISDSIRDTVISIHKAGGDDDLTVNYVRSGAEKKLRLPAGFLKDGEWKDKSKQWIKDAVVCWAGDVGTQARTNTSARTAIAPTTLRQIPLQRRPPKPSPVQSLELRKLPRSPPLIVHPVRPRGKQQPLRRSLISEGGMHLPTKSQRLRYLIHHQQGVLYLGRRLSRP